MLLKAAEKLNEILAFPFSMLGRGRITFPEFLEELETLGLKGETFGPEAYRIALERYLGIEIEVAFVADLANIYAQRAFVDREDTAILSFLPHKNLAVIFVLESLPELELTAAIYHELSHLAAGHRFIDAAYSGRRPSVSSVSLQLAKQPPPRTHKACETEARIREDYCILTGSLGERCLDQEQLRQVE